ncbi:MAG: hypothetical protein LBI03_11935 [Clostridiales bacterium]|jgi:hypothetical protein|nr:hypothetical protein [Clostridiales bacterium]
MTYQAITSEYYAKWIGTESGLIEDTGVFWIYNAERNDKPMGYSKALDVYAFITPRVIIISYGDKATDKIPIMKDKITLGMTTEAISHIMSETFLLEPRHNIKYVYSHIKTNGKCLAKRLSGNDYKSYLDFFKRIHLDCKDISWVKDYFMEI